MWGRGLPASGPTVPIRPHTPAAQAPTCWAVASGRAGHGVLGAWPGAQHWLPPHMQPPLALQKRKEKMACLDRRAVSQPP